MKIQKYKSQNRKYNIYNLAFVICNLSFVISIFFPLCQEIFGIGFLSAQTFTITQNITNVICTGENNGTASISVSGGTVPYTYQWNNTQTTSLATGLSAGTYSITITDSGSPANDSTISVSVSEPQPITIESDIQLPVCTNNGFITLTNVSGGTASYKYLWNIGSTNADISQLSAGNYYVTITDAANCKKSFSFNLTKGECEISPEISFTPNNDGYNDKWFITNSQYYPDAKVIVWDRWGIIVHKQKGVYEEWDGKGVLGIPVPDAVYYYVFFKTSDDKFEESKYGSVMILR
ncbi:MAG: gliding motility-associated C-terminal domain-containing protein [Bacteroidota bacterium]